MAKFTDTQLIMLSNAAARDDRITVVSPKSAKSGSWRRLPICRRASFRPSRKAAKPSLAWAEQEEQQEQLDLV